LIVVGNYLRIRGAKILSYAAKATAGMEII
jgi:hypothetical protein